MNSNEKNRKTVATAMLAAIVIVLQIVCTFIKFGPFSITLALTPIIIGAAVYGWKTGALLGFVFSAVVLISGLFGWDGGFILSMMQFSAVGTVAICLIKGTAAGAVSGAIYKALSKKSDVAASVAAAVAAPIVNTGLFAATMLTVFNGFLSANAPSDGSLSPVAMLFLSWIGVNFIVEFISNIVLSTVTTKVVRILGHRGR